MIMEAENKDARLVVRPSRFSNIVNAEIYFKKPISCLSTSIDVSKDLFHDFMQRCKTTVVKIRLFWIFNLNSNVIRKCVSKPLPTMLPEVNVFSMWVKPTRFINDL